MAGGTLWHWHDICCPMSSPILSWTCFAYAGYQYQGEKKELQWRDTAVCAAGACKSRSVGKVRWTLACSCCKRVHPGLPRGRVLLASPRVTPPALPRHLPSERIEGGFLLLSPAIFIATKLSEVRQGAAELVGNRTSSHRESQLGLVARMASLARVTSRRTSLNSVAHHVRTHQLHRWSPVRASRLQPAFPKHVQI